MSFRKQNLINYAYQNLKSHVQLEMEFFLSGAWEKPPQIPHWESKNFSTPWYFKYLGKQQWDTVAYFRELEFLNLLAQV